MVLICPYFGYFLLFGLWPQPPAVRRREGGGGFEGVCSNPPLASKKFYAHRLAVHFKCPTIWKCSNSLAAIENHHCPNKSGYSYWAGRMCTHKLFTPQRSRVHHAVLPAMVPSLVEIRSHLAQQMHTWTAKKKWMQYTASHVATTALFLSQNCLRSNLRASNI